MRNRRQKVLPAPTACPKKADISFHSQIAGQIGPPRQTRWVLSILDAGRNMFPRARQGRFISLAAHLPPREPTSISTRKLQVRSALTHNNPSVLSILEGSQATPRTAPVPPRRQLGLPQRRLAAPSALPRRQLNFGLVRRRTNLQLID